MNDVLAESLIKLKRIRFRKTWTVSVLLVLSLLVSLEVFWVLRQPGLTLAGDATCGIVEHTHDEACKNAKTPCEFEEHVHTISCYSNKNADLETTLDWQGMFSNYPFTGDLREDLIGIAKTQVGYRESSLNFEVGDDGVRRGYTRYGAWYGTPYSDWSATFVSFCLHYAGADEEEVPTNSGANSMAEIWKSRGKYASRGVYNPVAGDLVFFKNNTVGIITEINTSSFYVIRGDMEDTVKRDVLFLTDDSIAGWGSTKGTIYSSNGYLLDISKGPAVFIFAGNETDGKMQKFALRNTRSVKDLVSYLEANGGNYFFTLLDKNNQELSKDENGNYIVQAETGYKLTLSFSSPEGFVPGSYQYQIPNGLLVDGGEGTFILKDGTNVGSWVVTDDGLITLTFNDEINSRTDITISATLGIHFPEQEDPIDFDGKISVTVQKPDVEKEHTKLNKWGTQGKDTDSSRPDATKLYWTIEIQGKEGSNIPGSIITDQIKMGEHRFTQSDIAGGLRIGVGEYDLETGVQLAWHAWDVSPDDPNLVWDSNGWTYKMPETVKCKWCPNPITLGNDGWIYYVEYSSTPDLSSVAGTVWYTNEVTVDGEYMEGWGGFEHAPAQATIVKNGSFHGDADGGVFNWEFRAIVPGYKPGEKAVYLWQVMDNLRVKDGNNYSVGYVENDSNKSIVTATIGGHTVGVPNVAHATANDELAWYNMWSSDHGDGIYYGRALVFLCRCHCTEENCQFWGNNSCGSQYWYQASDGYWYTNGMCHCWTIEEDTVFNFIYETDDISVIENFGGQGYDLENEVLLQHTVYNQDGSPNVINSGADVVEVPIPGVFKKELTQDFDGYTAHYQVTVNEGKLVLTDGSPLTIHDAMTQTLAYISGSLVITAEDKSGNITTLKQGVDYNVSYDGTGTQTDSHGNSVHVLEIEILHPQPVMYILDYDTTLIIPSGATQAVKYSNSATITLWGEDITDSAVEKVYADINIAAKNFKVTIHKKCAQTGEPLGGAVFGLYNANGGLITSGTTNSKGELLFQSNIIEGIILREHILYYMQELKAPPGYQLDDTKYWFCFCDKQDNSCKTCDEILAGLNGTRIPFEQIGKVHIENQIMNYDLPATGGTGTYPLILVSVLFIITPMVYLFIRGRKRERRGVG